MPDHTDASHRTRASSKTNLAIQLAQELREQLRAGSLRAGDRLPTENELARHHQVSRTVVREAIAALRADGLVTARQGSGVYVAEPAANLERLRLFDFEPDKISSVIEVLEIRAALECEAAALAAERCSPAEILKIKECHAAIGLAVGAGERAEKQDFALHLAIAQCTHNRHFVEFFRFLGSRTIPRAQAKSPAESAPEMDAYLSKIHEEHAMIVEAIAARDPTRARATMMAHLKGSQKRYERLAERVTSVAGCN